MITDEVIFILLGIGAVAATFVGFSGVVVVFGERAHGDWLVQDRFRLVNMITMSLASCFLSFGPLILDVFHVSTERIWVLSSAISGAGYFLYFLYAFPQALKLMHKNMTYIERRLSISILLTMIAVTFLQIMNAMNFGITSGPGAYIIGLLVLIFVAGIQFAILVLTPIKKKAGI
jgi:hypothetical protein